MLKGIPKILSLELLKVLCEMGHSDRIIIADGNAIGNIERFAFYEETKKVYAINKK